jgi:hypothetical protein
MTLASFVPNAVDGHASGDAPLAHAATSLGTNGAGERRVTQRTPVIPDSIRDRAVGARFYPQLSRNPGSRINSGMTDGMRHSASNRLQMLDNPWFRRAMTLRLPTVPPRRWNKPRHSLNFLNIRFLQSSLIATRKGL